MLVLPICLASAVLPVEAEAAGLPLRDVGCGQSIYESLRVNNDPPICPLNGLIVAEDDITIDLNGHTIRGNNADNGGGVEYGVGTTSGFSHTNLRVVNGTVTGFFAGINFDGGSGLRVKNVRSTHNGEGIRVSGANVTGVVLSNNTLWENSSDGIQADHTPGIVISGNVASGNADEGMELGAIGGPATVNRNVVVGNGQEGILLTEATKGSVSGNDLSRNGANGLAMQESGLLVVDSNLASGNGRSGLTVGIENRTTFTRNKVLGNGTYGIGIFSAFDVGAIGNTASGNGIAGITAQFSSQVRIVKNLVYGNREVGISADGPDHVVGDNRTHGNGFGNPDGTGLGIDASTATDLKFSPNSARGNDEAIECNPQVICRANKLVSRSSLPLKSVGCGELIVKSIRVKNDLFDCPAYGLVVNKSGITIDLNGRTIDGDKVGNDSGILIGLMHDVTIVGGSVRNFRDGIEIDNSRRVSVRGTITAFNWRYGIENTFDRDVSILGGIQTHNEDSGIDIQAVDGLRVRGVTSTGNDGAGVRAEASSGVSVVGSVLAGDLAGAGIKTTPGAALIGNHASGNGFDGIHLEGATGATVARNVASGNGFEGIEIVGSGVTQVVKNVASGNGLSGIDGNGIFINGTVGSNAGGKVTANRTSGNFVAGILTGHGDRMRFDSNVANGNGSEGLFLLSVQNAVYTVVDNIAHGNGFEPPGSGDDSGVGILRPNPVIASGNRAHGNDDPYQCSSLTCG